MCVKDFDIYKVWINSIDDCMFLCSFNGLELWFDGGFKLDYVWDESNKVLFYIVVKIMMCIDLFVLLKFGEKIVLKIKWFYNINDCM